MDGERYEKELASLRVSERVGEGDEGARVQREASSSVCNCKVRRRSSSLHIRCNSRYSHLPLLALAFHLRGGGAKCVLRCVPPHCFYQILLSLEFLGLSRDLFFRTLPRPT